MIATRLIVLLMLCSATAEAANEPWSEDFTPPTDEFTWIQLDTGEWLKGEFIALYDEILKFDSDHFGDLDIELEDIERMYGQGAFEVTFDGVSPVNGTLQIQGENIHVEYGGQSMAFSRESLVSITPSFERERDRWTGDIDLGLNVRQGNTDISEFNVGLGVRRRTPVSRLSLDYIGYTNETDGERISDSHRINLSVDRFTGRRLFWRPISVQYYRDEFQNIAHQATVDTGLGLELVDTKRMDWELQAGVGGNYLDHVSVGDNNANNEWSPVGTFGSDLVVDITSWMEYELLINMTFLEENSGKYQHHIISTLSTDLIGDLDIDISLIWDRTEVPQESETGVTPEQDDYRFLVSLSYDF